LDREPEKDAKCEDCGVPLEELDEDEVGEEDDDAD
jgi:transcription initiation factor IIE alpha subunit